MVLGALKKRYVKQLKDYIKEFDEKHKKKGCLCL